ncbi:MAG: putative tRNA threonylcarbamoyladenosine biosynthesis protein Gcp, partial [candidate division WS6 bacterium 34_10]
EHEKNIPMVYEEALKKAKVSIEDIDYIASTYGPGLAIDLEIGLNFAKDLAIKYLKPFIPINHMEAHLLSGLLENSKALKLIIPALDDADLNHSELANFISSLQPISGITEYNQIFWFNQIFDEDYSLDLRMSRLEKMIETMELPENQLRKILLQLLPSEQRDEMSKLPIPKIISRVVATVGIAIVATGCIQGSEALSETDAASTEQATQLEQEERSFEPYAVQRGDGWMKVLSHWGINAVMKHDQRKGGSYWTILDKQVGQMTVVAMEEDENNPGEKIERYRTTLEEAVSGDYRLTEEYTLYLGDHNIPETTTGKEIRAQPATYVVQEGDSLNSLSQKYLSEYHLIGTAQEGNVAITIESRNTAVRTQLSIAEIRTLSQEEANIWPGDKVTFAPPYQTESN